MSTTPLSAILSTPISQPLPLSSLSPHLSLSPWHQVPGTFNLRSVSYPPLVKENFIYRSGMLALISNEGKKDIVTQLGVQAIYDLRSTQEREADPEPVIDGVRNHAVDMVDEDLDWTSLVDMYLSFLTTHREIFRNMFLHVLRSPDQPLLIHCTAGKDRTAVAVALLLLLAGVPQEAIAHDYALTRIGIEPVRDLLQAKLVGQEKEVDWENEIIREIAGCETRTIVGFIRELEKRFDGGAEGFVMKELGLTADEVEGIRKGLRSEQTREQTSS